MAALAAFNPLLLVSNGKLVAALKVSPRIRNPRCPISTPTTTRRSPITRPACPDAADIDDSGELAITDAVYLLNHLFLGGRAPPAPYPDRGRDPTPDSVACP